MSLLSRIVLIAVCAAIPVGTSLVLGQRSSTGFSEKAGFEAFAIAENVALDQLPEVITAPQVHCVKECFTRTKPRP
jgi:hypothetical protein